MTLVDLTTRDRVLRRIKALDLERSSWFDHWRSINDVLLPRSGRFFVTDVNRGERKNDILDDTGTAALTTLGAGMQSGMTSPARPWVRLETDDPTLMENANVSKWLDQVTRTILNVFARSNTYNSLHTGYEELGAFGVWADVVLPDFEKVIHHYPLTIGEYFLAANDRNEIDTLGRHYQMTVMQIVQRYVAQGSKDRSKSGSWEWSNVSTQVKNAWDSHNLDVWIPLYQLIDPRLERDSRMFDNKNMPWRSIVIETSGSEDKVLHESGYRRFPVLAPRWQVTGNDTYGSNCPGMRALGAIKQLQHEHHRKLQGIDFQVQPPIMVPTSLKGQEADMLPGGVTYYDTMGGSADTIRSAWDVRLDMSHLLADIQDVRQLIRSAFFTDVFLSMDNMPGIQPRNEREVQERHEEKLMMLGPVTERQQGELLTPLVNITFDACMEAGILPPPPEELQGVELKMEFVSVLAQAQRSTAMAGVDRWIGAIASVAAAKQDPSVWDNADTDQVIQDAAGYLGVSPEMARGKEDIQAIRESRAQAQQQAQQQQQAAEAANTAKTLAQAPVSTDNALGQVVRGFATQ